MPGAAASDSVLRSLVDGALSETLPIHDCLADIVHGLSRGEAVVLKAPPGAGKTTGVPPAILRLDRYPEGQILLAQPRRLAARAAAAQLARIIGGELGGTVGYHVRFDSRQTKHTRLLVLTYGMLLRRLQSDPLLDGVACVILDEFHERSLEADLALGMIERVRREFREELGLVVMSATLDPQPLVSFLRRAVPVTSEGRMFPVDVQYRPPLVRTGHHRQSTIDQVIAVLPEALTSTAGHLLVFLPGIGEINRVQRGIETCGMASQCDILPLYADLPIEDQDRVLARSTRRKIILATNVAETSITIEGVTGVIDSGLARVMRFDANIGLPKLGIESISQASADQRTGRAGRTQAGICFRLWHAAAHRGRPRVDVPEILRADFAPALLMLASCGERDASAFPWLEPPRDDAVQSARELLERLGAVDSDGTITPAGMAMSELPVHPRLAKILLDAASAKVLEDAAIAVALLTERDPFARSNSAHSNSGATPFRPTSSHGGNFIEAVHQVRRELAARHVSPSMKPIERVAKQLIANVRHRADESLANRIGSTDHDALARVLLAGFPDRVARRRESGGNTALMVGGKGVRLDAVPAMREWELLLCLNVNSIEGETRVSYACGIHQDWLDPKFLRTVDEPLFVDETRSMVARRRDYMLDLMLSDKPIQCKRGPAIGEVLARRAKEIWKQSLPPDNQSLRSYLSRIELLRDTIGRDELPRWDEACFDQWRVELASKCLSLEELSGAPWTETVRQQLDYAQQQLIEREAPARIQVPSGNEIAVIYEPGKSPVMQVRIQELFGWHDTPRVAKGRVPVQLHLLGPNYRIQQITEDLRNFWETTYIQVRKDLRARYPKHQWPEDPFTATASRNGLKPRT